MRRFQPRGIAKARSSALHRPRKLGVASSSRALSATQSLFAPSTRTEMDPQFSPDGRKIAFTSDRSGNTAIWVGDRDGSNIAQLTNVPECIAGSPRWSPDSVRLAFD